MSPDRFHIGEPSVPYAHRLEGRGDRQTDKRRAAAHAPRSESFGNHGFAFEDYRRRLVCHDSSRHRWISCNMACALPLLSPSQPHDSTTVSAGNQSVASRYDAMAGCIVLTLCECWSRDGVIPRRRVTYLPFPSDESELLRTRPLHPTVGCVDCGDACRREAEKPLGGKSAGSSFFS